MPGLYLHIPFCRKACHYCDFHFSVNQASLPQMVDAMLVEAELRKGFLGDEPIETLYFGGGTPSLLPAAELTRLMMGLESIFDLTQQDGLKEVTLEANPEDVNPESLALWKALGINRLSLGIQTLNQDILSNLNRAHTADQGLRALELIHQSDFPSSSADLIFGLPGQTLEGLAEDIALLTGPLSLPHISIYHLTIEEGTVFGKRARKGERLAAPEDTAARMMELIYQTLHMAGYEAYEVSNFARPGHRARHNTAYWQGKPYLGIGPSAHSFDGGFVRTWNVRSNGAYIAALGKGELPIEQETLTPKQRFNEQLMTGLRMQDGFAVQEWASRLGVALEPTWLERVNTVGEGGTLLKHTNSTLTLTTQGRLLADHISSELFL